ncbi:MAG TPA: DnaJ domain-containing protein [Reyranella sp.]|nr:DnaJ domain-containing protein [Reyranella sp.]
MIASLPDYYALLGVAARADRQAIRTAYRALAKQYHPDAAGPETASADRFVRIQEAYDVLGDPDRRAQYDLECARRRDAAEELLRQQRAAFAHRRAPGMAPGFVPPMPPPALAFHRKRTARGWLYAGGVTLAVITAATVIVQQRLERMAAEREQMTIVRVDPPRHDDRYGDRDAVAANLSALSRDVERVTRLQASQVEAARSRLAAHEGEKKAPTVVASLSPPQQQQKQKPPEGDGRVSCSGEGRKFSVVRQSDTISVSYNGGAPTQPLISDQGIAGMIVMSKVEPTGLISIGFIRGDKDRTILIVTDSVGNIFRTIGVDCSGAVF